MSIIPANGNQNEAVVVISKKDWDSIVETIYLEGTGTLAKVSQRMDDDSGFSDFDDVDWDK
ncbi:hypothetical protein [Xylocopilactobacillus apis]|uniref:hypothetical protein n=1 Tax=Xylocopilactobacillus apis TaxID=2932183 RepID=UPI003CE49AD2